MAFYIAPDWGGFRFQTKMIPVRLLKEAIISLVGMAFYIAPEWGIPVPDEDDPCAAPEPLPLPGCSS